MALQEAEVQTVVYCFPIDYVVVMRGENFCKNDSLSVFC